MNAKASEIRFMTKRFDQRCSVGARGLGGGRDQPAIGISGKCDIILVNKTNFLQLIKISDGFT